MFKLILTILYSLFFISSYVNAEITEDMKTRALQAGVIIERDHDPKRTYLSNDYLARDTHMNMQLAYRHAQNNDPEKAAALTLISANRGLDYAQVSIAKMYVHGIGVEENVIEAYKFFKLSEDQTAQNLYLKVIIEKMTPEEIALGDKLVENFIGSYK
ncbi:MAG: hypothetical protein CMJ14_00030 [Pelagibacterales bacterium]|nr:hypothetical protein [Pelagibacterales bacterium]|tara:strand:- start:391 stop:864 length:474 start_codon:yes stop_codon:yes gene_type:complete